MPVGDEAKAIGERLRQLRGARGLSQRQLTKGTGISAAYISRIENGSRLPSVRVLRELAPKLGVSTGFLETGEEKAEVVVQTVVQTLDLTELPLAELLSEIGRRLPKGVTISIEGGMK